ncbi:hypothetical protein [Puniceibacterium sediminis]|uniref:Uncharacterized protein n=1 Tax=Puniceibacterium sediminis TaxID=1608407 RepID=A0A238WGX6_9RHOB|nr:hypothetical protein [Puniceibacterium sediminis]SNR45697.1 hypothetical protein SAMN06265370_105220 [Puniceibacterium sediminis]
MIEYDGAVLFVDILGISALTTSEKPLVSAHDFKALAPKCRKVDGNQLFCARLLSQFRKNLHECNIEGLKIAQLSDCAFLWSRSESLVVQAAHRIFFENTRTGILARGGMTFGQIIEPKKTRRSLGHFICGNAVTRAAQLEGAGKGARVFIDREIGGRPIVGVSPRAFEGMPNPSDYRMIDEFIWFSCPKEFSDHSEKMSRLKELVRLLVSFKSSPKFRWNAASSHGRIHLGATIERLCKAASELCEEIKVQPPHFAMQTSELFQEVYNEEQYSDQEHAKNLVKLERWASQMFADDRKHSSAQAPTR